MKPTFAEFLKALHKDVHTMEAAADDTASFDIGYAMGKLVAHYKRKMTNEGIDAFDRGMVEGFTVGHLRKLQ